MPHSPPTCPGPPLPLTHSHTCADTRARAHTHPHTLFPSSGQETAQCSEAPFSIFVVVSAWLLREVGRTEGWLREQEGAQGSTKQGGEVAEQCQERSGCRATVRGWVRARGPSARGAESVQAPEQSFSHRESLEGQPCSAVPPRMVPLTVGGEGGGTGPSLPSFLSKSTLPAGTRVLRTWKP